jgi:hypothetical protein
VVGRLEDKLLQRWLLLRLVHTVEKLANDLGGENV